MSVMAKRPLNELPCLSSDTSEDWIADLVSPHLQQLVELTNDAVHASDADAAVQQCQLLCLHVSHCLHQAFDCILFGNRGVLGFVPCRASRVAPSAATALSVVLFCCGGAEASVATQVDRCRAEFVNPRDPLSPGVVARPVHVLGGIFCVAVPLLPWLISETEAVTQQVRMRCGEGGPVATATVSLRRPPGRRTVRKPYSLNVPQHHLHYAALSGDVSLLVKLLALLQPRGSTALKDESGIEAPPLALLRGWRVPYSLLFWTAQGWPVHAVCQLLRVRMELESNLVEADVFFSVRDSVLESVLHNGPTPVQYRPIKYQTGTFAQAYRGPLAVVLLPETPFTEHEYVSPWQSSSSDHRRGSLHFLLQAIEVLDGEGK